jgi:two-component system response regulator
MDNDQNDPMVFLLVEDNEHDIMAVKRAWQENRIRNALYVVRSGDECLDYLYRRGKFSRPESAPRPDVVLLNNRLPKTNGLELLRKIRESEEFHYLPVIMFTASESESDQLKAYDLLANAYIVKPMNFENLSAAIRSINAFWQLARIPEDHDAEKN